MRSQRKVKSEKRAEMEIQNSFASMASSERRLS